MLALAGASSVTAATPVVQVAPGTFGGRVVAAATRCWWVQGYWGPQQVCRHHDRGHFDWHPGHWDEHGDHLDYHPGHWDYHHRGHRHHLDED